MSQKNPVAQPCRSWKEMASTWKLVDTLFGGTQAMRSAAREYLPQEPAEPEAAYFNRLSRSVLTPIYPDAIRKLVAKPLKQPVVLEDDVPPKVAEFRDDIDACGTGIDDFTRRVGEAALNHGVTFILVEAPPNVTEEGETLTVADETALNIRPYAVHITAPQVIGWKTEVMNGRVTLTQVRIRVTTWEDSKEDEFTQTEVHRIYVHEIGMVRTYRLQVDENKEERWVLENTVGTDLDFIPLIPVYGQKVDFMQGEPPMVDVAYLNVTHWQSDSDQRNILHVARVPLLFASGLGDEDRGDFQLQVGPNTLTRGPQGSDMKFVEHSGSGIEAGANDLKTLEERMAKLGLNMLIRRSPGDVTATSRALDQSESDSPLGMFARSLEAALETMLDYFAIFLGLGEDAGGSVTLFKDFSISLRDSEDIKALGEMRGRGDISKRTYWEELKRRGLLSDDFDADAEIDLLELEAPALSGFDDFGNRIGDETGSAAGHTHILQDNGVTNTVDGHQHRWDPSAESTSVADGHSHSLRGIPDEAISSQGQQGEGAPAAGTGQQVNQPQGQERTGAEGEVA